MDREIRLNNGAVHPMGAVAMTMVMLRALFAERPDMFRELFEKCRDHRYPVRWQFQEELIGMALMDEQGMVHEIVRDTVLSAVECEGPAMVLGDAAGGRDAGR